MSCVRYCFCVTPYCLCMPVFACAFANRKPFVHHVFCHFAWTQLYSASLCCLLTTAHHYLYFCLHDGALMSLLCCTDAVVLTAVKHPDPVVSWLFFDTFLIKQSMMCKWKMSEENHHLTLQFPLSSPVWHMKTSLHVTRSATQPELVLWLLVLGELCQVWENYFLTSSRLFSWSQLGI